MAVKVVQYDGVCEELEDWTAVELDDESAVNALGDAAEGFPDDEFKGEDAGYLPVESVELEWALMSC